MKIGVFDSGLGGLTVVQAMTKIIKGAEIFYVADTKNAPYGEKTPQQILKYSLDITKFLTEKHKIDALIIACNTATSAAIQEIRKVYPDLIVIGTEPGIKPAFEQSETGKIGVLATPATLKGKKYQQLANVLSSKKEVVLFEQACPGLVEQIENGEIHTQKTREMLENWLSPMRKADVDTIVLGCTHYPLVSKVIESVMGRELNLIHTGEAISKRLLSLSREKGHKNYGKLDGILYTTDNISKDIVRNIINKDIEIKAINL